MNKKLKSIEVGLIGCGDAVTLNASDTATEPIATYALDKFKAEDQMSFKDNGTEYFVPFHAVDHIEVTETTESVADRPNPYGCEGGSKSEGEIWYTGTFGECQNGYKFAHLTATSQSDFPALLANPQDYEIYMNGIALIIEDALSNAIEVSSDGNSISGEFYLDGDTAGGEIGYTCDSYDFTEAVITVAHK